ncbi:MAG: hypothetical protein IJB08_06300 [Alistipes sp.]|nr:hypothetical protein [Alistipes sp.]
MKHIQTVCTDRQHYVAPDLMLVEIPVEHGFAVSTEIFDKDEETEF